MQVLGRGAGTTAISRLHAIRFGRSSPGLPTRSTEGRASAPPPQGPRRGQKVSVESIRWRGLPQWPSLPSRASAGCPGPLLS